MKPKEGIAVDGSCLGNPGKAAYRGVDLATGKIVFRNEIKGLATNNIAEFLAIGHAIGYCKKNNINPVIYSDSQTAMFWLIAGRCNSKLNRDTTTEEAWKLIDRVDTYIKQLTPEDKAMVKKWLTREWGEIPADYGNKK